MARRNTTQNVHTRNRHIIKLIQQFLKNRQFRIKYEKENSTCSPRIAVVTDALATFTADIPKPDGTTMGLYADDLVLMATDRNTNFAKTILQ